jgi:hypothetical protein
MKQSSFISKQLKDAYYGGNYTGVHLKELLSNINWQEATTKVQSFNTIAMLAYHINYYVIAVSKVLEGGPLDAHDKYSYDCPPIQSQEDWEALVQKTFADADTFIALIEQMPDEKIWTDFIEPKYGSWYRNLAGTIEHVHYHMGQIALIKKLLKEQHRQ